MDRPEPRRLDVGGAGGTAASVAEPVMRVLMVEDDPGDADLVREYLDGPALGACELSWARSLAEAASRLRGGGLECVLLDLHLPDAGGLEAVERLRSACPDVPLVVLTGASDEDLGWRAVRLGAQDCLPKDAVDPRGLWRAVRHAVERHRRLLLSETLAAVRAREADLEGLIEAHMDAVLLVDGAGRLVRVNAAAAAFFGRPREVMLGTPFPYPLVLGESVEIEVPWPPGARVGEMKVSEVGYQGERHRLATIRDLTDRRRMEEELRQAQKMEAIGRLAGGVAHDFNNLLGVIMAYGELIQDGVDERDPIRADLEEVLKAARRAAGLTRQLLAFSRRQFIQPRPVDLREVVFEVEGLLGRLLGEDIAIDSRAAGEPWPVRADPGQVEQVVMNLAVNARDAMPRGGRLLIRLENVSLAALDVADLPPGDYVRLSVSDTGEGMDDQTRMRIFEPFFTTKEKGKGTGLGLSTVYGIVKQHGGHIEAVSAPGEGATFHVWFPAAPGDEVAGRAPLAVGPRAPRAGAETILLVDDDQMLRGLGSRILRASGHTVLEAASGAEALLISERHGG
ncbi:MAG: response regulator, partial [Planctomycetes bacterium]|nr:response regulator [Planctomycetota bacterium]